MIGKLDHRVGQQRQRPAPPAGRRLGACSRHQQGLFFAVELALRAGTWLLAQGPLQIAFHEAALGPIDGRTTHADGAGNLLVAAAGVGRQQNLRSFEFAGGMFAAAQHRSQFVALGLAQLDPITYIHRRLPVGGPGRIDR